MLGLSYKGNLKVDILSPTVPFVNYLLKKKIKVKLFDPYYNEQEIKKITNLKMIKFPNELNDFECVVVSVDHKYFKDKVINISKNLKNCKYILDNMGIWKNFKFSKKINYKISGEENWI